MTYTLTTTTLHTCPSCDLLFGSPVLPWHRRLNGVACPGGNGVATPCISIYRNGLLLMTVPEGAEVDFAEVDDLARLNNA